MIMSNRHIVAMGGGGFSMEPLNPLLDLYVLNLTGKENPKVCFIPTASGDSQGYIDRFYKSFGLHKCIPSHLSLFSGQTADLESFVMEQDVLYVGGGNTRNLLTLWKEWGLDKIIQKMGFKDSGPQTTVEISGQKIRCYPMKNLL